MRNFILFTVTLLTFGFCYTVGYFLDFSSFAFAWILNFSLMALYTFIVSRIKLQLNSSYFEPRKFEKRGKLYEVLGVPLYKKLLVWIGWEKLNKKNTTLKPNYNTLKHLEYQTRSSEFGHAVIFVLVLVTASVVTDNLLEAKWLIILNLLLNLYPVLLQRYNRPRYKMLLLKLQRKNRKLSSTGNAI